MRSGFAAEIRRILLIALGCFVFGIMNGHLAWTIIAGGTLYAAWSLWQIYQLERWLNAKEPGLPPDASGVWGEIFDRIYHLQKRQDREKQRLQSVLNRVQDTTAALPDGVVVLDARGNMSWWNETAVQLLALQTGDLGKPLVHFIREPKFIKYYEAGKYREPLTMTSPAHEAKRLQFQITRYGQGERLVSVRDITRIHRLEEMRKDFVANVSHELRTPLTVIKGYLETLMDMPGVPSKMEKPFQQMRQQSERMSLLVNDLITLSRLETEDPGQDQEAVHIPGLLRSIRNEAEIVSNGNHPITLECDIEVSLRGNQKELHSAFSNLVINAIKYSPPGTPVTVRVKEDDAGLIVAVADKGPGIDAIHLPRLTERFYRVEQSRASSTGGTGLGLAIVKHILRRHDARLQIDSELGKGSTFSCIFPKSRVVVGELGKRSA